MLCAPYFCGGDVRKFEPAFLRKTLSYGRIDKIVGQLRRFYKENPASFDIPTFAVNFTPNFIKFSKENPSRSLQNKEFLSF
jgi:hypothetical protein